MKCAQCQHENPSGAKFCMECGAKLENVCPECGAKLPPEAKFCMECGAKIAESAPKGVAVPRLEDVHVKLQRSMPKSLAAQMQAAADTEGENRIISILFADVSGSVAVTENMPPEDAADLISECLKTMVDIILKYSGTINRFLGDSVLAFFGIPETHENDPERAISAALDMREAVSKLNLNISTGINTGMVYVGAIGPDSHSEFTAMGTAVNLAARLEKEADPGQILVGQATYRPTRRTFEFNPLKPMTIKGISEPVNAYEVIKALSRPDKIRGIEGLRAEMIGREKEFADLKDSADELLSGRGQIATIMGEAGVGKSRLVTELKEYLADREIRWLEGRCVSIGESIGYWVFVDMLRGYLEFAEDDTPETLREKIVSSMRSLFPQRWEEIVPYIGNLLSVRSGEWDDRIKHLPPEQMKHQTFFTLRDVFFALSQQKPLLLVFEDLHWADNLSLDMINLLMDDLTRSPLMLLCVYRPYKEHRSWHISAQASAKCLDRYREITLRPLNTQESRRLVGALLDIENLPESIRESILKKAEGNPFFVEEVIRSLIESGVVYQDDDRWVAKAEIEDITIPDTIQSVIMSRIDRLEDEARYVLQSASVIGRLFRHKLLGYIMQQEQRLDEYLWNLEERDLVYEERAIPELEYSFRHVLTQETAYNTILSRRRREFHRKVAEGYEALYSSRLEEYYEELAYHYSRSDDSVKALDYLVKAGDKSRQSFANDAAIGYYRQALALIDSLDAESKPASTIGHIYHSLSEIYFPLMKYEEALECYHKALDYITDSKLRARIYGTIGWIYQQNYNELDTALEHLNLGIAELADDTECPEMAWISIPFSWVAIRQGSEEKAIEIAQRGLRIVEGTEHYFETAELCGCLNYIYSSYDYRDLDKVYEYAQKGMEAAQRSGNLDLMGRASVKLGHAHMLRDEDDSAVELCREGIEIAKKTGNSFSLELGYLELSQIYEKREDWEEAIECIEHCLEIPDHPHRGWRLHQLAYIYVRIRNDDTAIDLLIEAIKLAKKRGDDLLLSVVYELLSWIYHQREDWDRAIELLECCLEIPEHPDRSQSLYSLARVYMKKGDTRKAIEYSKEALESVETLNSVTVSVFLSFMEESFVLAGKREEFIAYCRKLREEKAEALPDMKLNQWYFEPAEISDIFIQTAFVDEFDGQDLMSEWKWVNPRGDSSYSFSSAGKWLEMRAASRSGLWEEFHAPRLLQELSGDFAVEVWMKASSDDLPSVGGLLVWKDEDNYIRFERGMHLENEISLSSCIQGKYDRFGRGRLPSDIVYLRLERIGDVFSAYCSDDGENWLTCGYMDFPADDPIKVGIHAIGGAGLRGGNMDTATQFGSFRVLRRPS